VLCLQRDADPVDVRNVTICNLDLVAIVMPPRIDSRWEIISSDRIDEHADRRAILPRLSHSLELKGTRTMWRLGFVFVLITVRHVFVKIQYR
jgi:hypothetical protein